MTLQIGRMSNDGLPQWIKEEERPQRQKKRGVNMPGVCPNMAWCSQTTSEMIEDTDWALTVC